jgi:hypothetical protein
MKRVFSKEWVQLKGSNNSKGAFPGQGELTYVS